jgi:hypothetical protein
VPRPRCRRDSRLKPIAQVANTTSAIVAATASPGVTVKTMIAATIAIPRSTNNTFALTGASLRAVQRTGDHLTTRPWWPTSWREGKSIA